MRKTAKWILVLALFAGTGLLGYRLFWTGAHRRGPGPPGAGPEMGLTPGFVRQVERAGPVEAARLLREAQATSGVARRELAALTERRGRLALRQADRELERLISRYRYATATARLDAIRRAWYSTPTAEALAQRIAALRTEQAEIVAGRKAESEELMEAGRYEGALETLKTGWELEGAYQERLTALRLEMRARVRAHSATRVPLPPAPSGGGRAVPVVATSLGDPPALPGYPHPDIKRLADARAALARARKLFSSRRYQPAIKALDNVVGYFGDLQYVKRNRDAVAAMQLLAHHGTVGLKGLFHANSVTLGKGRHITLRYAFEGEAEFLDWEQTRTIPQQAGGEFAPVRAGVRGTGSTSYLLRAFFRNAVTMSVKARIAKPKAFGLLYCQQDLETRQLMWLACNHKIIEGENYVKERPGHSLIMWGKGTNADVPVDSPDVGFIIKGPSVMNPTPPPGATVALTFSVKADHMVGTIRYRRDSGTHNFHTKGDDGRSIEKLRPGLFVLENGVTFSEIVIKGTLHKDFERTRIDELLDLAGTLD